MNTYMLTITKRSRGKVVTLHQGFVEADSPQGAIMSKLREFEGIHDSLTVTVQLTYGGDA